MADSTVSSLPAATTLDGTELYYGVQGGGDVKVTGSQIKTLASDLSTATGNLAVSHLNSGTSASSSTFWRGDGTWATAAAPFTVGTTTITSGTSGRFLYDNSAVVGEALIRYSAANLFLGDADAASPVAQTISPQNVVTGTSNAAGADWTLKGSKGTGTGIGGSIIFQIAPAGGSGTSQNALATAMTIDSTGAVIVPVLNAPVAQNSKSANYTTVLADSGKHILHPSADTTARDFTIDSNANVAYLLGTVITFVNQHSGGVITIKIASDTMRLAGAGTAGDRFLAADGIATAIKVATTEWLISGTGLT